VGIGNADHGDGTSRPVQPAATAVSGVADRPEQKPIGAVQVKRQLARPITMQFVKAARHVPHIRQGLGRSQVLEPYLEPLRPNHPELLHDPAEQLAGSQVADRPLWCRNPLSNDEHRFGQVADDRLDDIVAENAERNTEFMKLYFDNPEFQKAIKETARKRAYRIILDPARDEAIARLRAEMARETGSGGIQ